MATARRARTVSAALVGLVLVLSVTAWALVRDRSASPTEGSVEAGFVRDMAVHGAQAIEMATIEQDRTADPTLEVLARDVGRRGRSEIDQLHGLLDQWGLPTTGPDAPMDWMGHAPESMPGMDHHEAMLMPGMATPLQLQPLRSAPANVADVTFLRLMISHRQGGIELAKGVLDRTRRDEVRRFAKAAVRSRSSEVRTLRRLLTARGGVEGPPVVMPAPAEDHGQAAFRPARGPADRTALGPPFVQRTSP